MAAHPGSSQPALACGIRLSSPREEVQQSPSLPRMSAAGGTGSAAQPGAGGIPARSWTSWMLEAGSGPEYLDACMCVHLDAYMLREHERGLYGH